MVNIKAMAKQIKEHFGGIPTKDQMKEYVIDNFKDNQYSTVQLMKALEDTVENIKKILEDNGWR